MGDSYMCKKVHWIIIYIKKAWKWVLDLLVGSCRFLSALVTSSRFLSVIRETAVLYLETTLTLRKRYIDFINNNNKIMTSATSDKHLDAKVSEWLSWDQVYKLYLLKLIFCLFFF